jgi:hypothetical protein
MWENETASSSGDREARSKRMGTPPRPQYTMTLRNFPFSGLSPLPWNRLVATQSSLCTLPTILERKHLQQKQKTPLSSPNPNTRPTPAVAQNPAHLVDVLALELGDELVELLRLGLDADGLEEGRDVRGGGGGVAAELEEEVGGEVLHLRGAGERQRANRGGGETRDE